MNYCIHLNFLTHGIHAERKACPEYSVGSPVLNYTKFKLNLFLLLRSVEWLNEEGEENREERSD